MQKLLGNKLYDEIERNIGITNVTEIRCRLNKPILVKSSRNESFLRTKADKFIINNIVEEATYHSKYAYEQEISDGYLEYENGIRIGICGKGKINSQNLIAYNEITSLCIRIPHAIPLPGALDCLTKKFSNTLVVGPPYSGKTTLIRSITSVLGEKKDIIVIDERYEIAGKHLYLLNGSRLDILQGVKKEKTYENIIRSMSPEIVVCDELFSSKDIDAIMRFSLSGIKCLASYHAAYIDNVPQEIQNFFSTFILLNNKPNPGSITSIIRKND